jgi:hypothetical protein
MSQYGYKPEPSEAGVVSRIVIEPNYSSNEEFPGKLSVMMLDAEDRLVDVWSANDINEAAALLIRYGGEAGYEINKVESPQIPNEGDAPEPPWPVGGDVGGV